MIVDATESDSPLLEDIGSRSGVLNDDEMDALGAVWEEFLLLGPEDSGYEFLVDRVGDRVSGFVCYGPRDFTDGVFDLHYLVVDPDSRRQSVGRRLLRAAEAESREAGARMMVAETSTAARYAGIEDFFTKAGFQPEARIKDLYAAGEDMVVFVKRF